MSEFEGYKFDEAEERVFEDEETANAAQEAVAQQQDDEEFVVEEGFKPSFADIERTAATEESDLQLRQLVAILNNESYRMFSGVPKDFIIEYARRDPRHRVWHIPTYIVAYTLVSDNIPQKEMKKAIVSAEDKFSNEPDWKLNVNDITRYVRYLMGKI